MLALTPTGEGGDVLVVTVTGEAPWVLPAGTEVLVSSVPLVTGPDGAPALPGPATAWLRSA